MLQVANFECNITWETTKSWKSMYMKIVYCFNGVKITHQNFGHFLIRRNLKLEKKIKQYIVRVVKCLEKSGAKVILHLPAPHPPTHLSTYQMLFFLNKLRLILVHDSSLSPEWEIILINCWKLEILKLCSYNHIECKICISISFYIPSSQLMHGSEYLLPTGDDLNPYQ